MFVNWKQPIAPVHPRHTSASVANGGPVLNLTVVYEDRLTRRRAAQICRPTIELAGPDSIHRTFWSLRELADREILRDAGWHALEPDILVISVYGSTELPGRYFEKWLRPGPARERCLIAVIGIREELGASSLVAAESLARIARRGRWDFTQRVYRIPGPTVRSRRGAMTVGRRRDVDFAAMPDHDPQFALRN